MPRTLSPAEISSLDAASSEAYGNLQRRSSVSFDPEPQLRPARVPIVSVDDHFVEPPHVFTRFMPKKFGDRIPRVVENGSGVQFWQFEDSLTPLWGPHAVAGRPRSEWTQEPLRFDEMRAAAYDPVARLHDMDISGVAASLMFPSSVFGFGGQRFFRMKDPELGLAAMRAYNDWIIEEWVASDPRRFIAQQVPWYPDPVVAGEEVRRNASRGFRAVAFSENPEELGFPSVHTEHWDPFFRACEETGTVINLHLGSSSKVYRGSSGATIDVFLACFPVNAIMSSVDWLYARVPLRFPGLKIVFSESGVSWVPTIQERLRRNVRMAEANRSEWHGQDEPPDEVFKRAFWFTSIEDPSGIEQRHKIGVDRIMLETDYPHNDSSWPDTQDIVADEIGHLPDDEMRRIAYKNAAHVYDLSVPEIETIVSGMSVTAA